MSRKAFAVIIKPLIDLHGEPKNWEAKIGIYFTALRDIPEDLLALAVREAIRTSEFFPKPAELRALIAEAWAHRRAADAKRREPAYLPAPERRPPTEEEKAEVDRLAAKAIAALKTRSAILTDQPELEQTA